MTLCVSRALPPSMARVLPLCVLGGEKLLMGAEWNGSQLTTWESAPVLVELLRLVDIVSMQLMTMTFVGAEAVCTSFCALSSSFPTQLDPSTLNECEGFLQNVLQATFHPVQCHVPICRVPPGMELPLCSLVVTGFLSGACCHVFLQLDHSPVPGKIPDSLKMSLTGITCNLQCIWNH